MYQRLVQRNELADGKIQGPNKLVDLADVRVPVMNVAGTNDVMVPVEVAHHVGELLPNSPEVRLETAPGGHLGVLTTLGLSDDMGDDRRLPRQTVCLSRNLLSAQSPRTGTQWRPC